MSFPLSKLLQSPLRYPGGKQALVRYIADFLIANDLTGRQFIEPFAGGAAVSLNLVNLELVSSSIIIERDPLMYAFWYCVKNHPGVLCERILRINVDLATWRRLNKYRVSDAIDRFELIDLGVAGLFFNRTNYSGIIGANPIGGMSQGSGYAIHCRFNKDTIISRICRLRNVMTRIQVVYSDGIGYLRRRKALLERDNIPVYVDPPYYKQGHKLYRYHFVDRDHQRLATFLNKCYFPWLVSYDDDPFIQRLFENQKIRPIFLSYTVRQARMADELLITNQKKLPRISGRLAGEGGRDTEVASA